MAYVSRTSVSVGDKDIKDLTVPLEPTGRIKFSVLAEGTLRVPRTLRVSLEPGSGQGTPIGGSVTLGADNSGTLDGVEGGEYVLRFINLVRSVRQAGVEVLGRPIRVVPGADSDPIQVVLAEAGATNRTSVTDDHGLAAGALVVAFSVDEQRWTNYGFVPQWIVARQATTKGEAVLDVPAGEFFVVAIPASFQDAWIDPGFPRAATPFSRRVVSDWGHAEAVRISVWDGWHR
jgi:hypothetical protein